MELFLALLGATGVAMAIAANATSIARFVAERRGMAAKDRARTSPTAAEGTSGAAAATGPDASRSRAADQPMTSEHANARPAVGGQPPPSPAIRTPDQRVRVFVSSTLGELASERIAARRAIESLRLTPVMFELGARTHPPRDVYRAYLAQSDVFVGVYGERYGWVAPGEDISGLEDEYRLATDLPKLVYVRRADGPREPRLQALLDRIRADDRVSYKSFDSADELAELIGEDVAVLLSERFAQPVAAIPRPRDDARPRPTPAPLPTPMTSFVGRDALVEEVREALLRPEVRLLTLYGPGGAGKSRLAIALAAEVADAFDGNVYYVTLATVRDPGLVPATLAMGLGVQEEVGITTVEAMQLALADGRALLLIDNFEHLIDAAPVVAELMAAAPGLTVVVTSRSVLRLSGEVSFHVPPLELPEPTRGPSEPTDLMRHGAVRLFVERARAVDPHFELDDGNASAVEAICRRVDALPLAIELAAARVRSLPPNALLARMTRRLPLLSGGPRDAPERQRTLRDTIDWSVALLSVEERSLFERLAVFDGGASLASVERVLGGSDDVLESLTSLIDKSLLQRVDTGRPLRIVMLETVREYAHERFERLGDVQTIRERHAEAFLELAEQGSRALKGRDQRLWQQLLDDDLGNLRAALTSFLEGGASNEALRLATALRPLFMARCNYEEGIRMLETALAASPESDGAARAAALLALGALTWRKGDLAASLAPIEASLATYRSIGDRPGAAAALRLYGIHAHNAGTYDVAQARLEEALDLMRSLGDAEGAANTLLSLGNVAFDRGESVAVRHYEDSRAICDGIGDVLGVAYALDNLGTVAWCRGDLTAAEARNAEIETMYERLDHALGRANVSHRRGLVALARGDAVGAETHLQASLVIRQSIGDVRGSAFVRFDLGRAALAAGDLATSRERFAAGLDLADRHGAPLIRVLYLEGVADLQAELGAPASALELLSTANAWRRAQRVPPCAVNRPRHEALVRRLRRTLAPEAWRERSDIGRDRSLAEAVGVARTCLEAREVAA